MEDDTKLWLRVNKGAHNRATQTPLDQLVQQLPEEQRKQPITWREKLIQKQARRKGVTL